MTTKIKDKYEHWDVITDKPVIFKEVKREPRYINEEEARELYNKGRDRCYHFALDTPATVTRFKHSYTTDTSYRMTVYKENDKIRLCNPRFEADIIVDESEVQKTIWSWLCSYRGESIVVNFSTIVGEEFHLSKVNDKDMESSQFATFEKEKERRIEIIKKEEKKVQEGFSSLLEEL